MRIAHISATFPPYRGGTGNVCLQNARELARRGHTVTVLTAGVAGAAAREQLDGVTVLRLPALLRVGNAPLLPGLLPALRGFDIIHLHYPFIGGAELTRLAAALYRTPLVVSFHNDLIGDGLRAPVFSLYQRCSARLTVAAAARLCAVSLDHFQASALRRSLPASVPTVDLPNGVDTARFYPTDAGPSIRERFGIPVSARLALFVAALDRAHHFKGLGRLLEALATLPPDVRLLVVGDGDLRAEYQRRAAELGLASRTIFVGGVDHDDTPAFFRAADITVLPSSAPESFGLVLIESMACATPVVASNIPGVRTVVAHGIDGLLVKEGSVAELGMAMRRILDDETARREMGRRGRANVEARYTWEQIGARLEGVYGDVLGASNLAGRRAQEHP